MLGKIPLRLTMFIFSFVLVLSSVITSGWIMVYSISSAFEKELGQRAIAIARTVSQLSDIKTHIQQTEGAEIIQPIAERIRLATNVDYIVVFDMNRIRYSHPSESKIGTPFEGGDELASLSEHEYISKAHGVQGYAIRAFVPIMDEEGIRQVGVVVVGILAPTFQALLLEYQNDILLSLVWGLAIGLLGSWLLANHIKRQTLNLEPYEIAKLVEERSAVMQAMDIGIIATDDQGKINFINRRAKEYIKADETCIGKSFKNYFPQTWITSMESIDREVINRPLLSHGIMYLISIHPIYVKGHLAGSLITLTDRTEANVLAEELTGVRSLVDALRAQNHEYMNKLHSIAGLIQLERTEEALRIIIDETSDEQNLMQFLRDNIREYSVSGLLLGKRSRARELGVHLTIDEHSYLSGILEGFSAGDLVTMIGNLIDNAIESFQDKDEKEKHVYCLVQGETDELYLLVKDNGDGMTKEEKEKMFKYGFSTKASEGRGIGMPLVKQLVDAQHGEINVSSTKGEGTAIEIKIGKKKVTRYD